MPEGLTPREIDDFVAAAMTAGEDLYRLDAAPSPSDADLVVTQTCVRCLQSTSARSTTAVLPRVPRQRRTLDPHTLDDVLATIVEVGRLTGRTTRPRRSSPRCTSAWPPWPSGSPAPRPRVLVLEWTDPPFAPGHWIPRWSPCRRRADPRRRGHEVDRIASRRPSRHVQHHRLHALPLNLDGSAVYQRHRRLFPDVPVDDDAHGHYAARALVVDGVEVLTSILHPGMAAPITTDRSLPRAVAVPRQVSAGRSAAPPQPPPASRWRRPATVSRPPPTQVDDPVGGSDGLRSRSTSTTVLPASADGAAPQQRRDVGGSARAWLVEQVERVPRRAAAARSQRSAAPRRPSRSPAGQAGGSRADPAQGLEAARAAGTSARTSAACSTVRPPSATIRSCQVISRVSALSRAPWQVGQGA